MDPGSCASIPDWPRVHIFHTFTGCDDVVTAFRGRGESQCGTHLERLIPLPD